MNHTCLFTVLVCLLRFRVALLDSPRKHSRRHTNFAEHGWIDWESPEHWHAFMDSEMIEEYMKGVHECFDMDKQPTLIGIRAAKGTVISESDNMRSAYALDVHRRRDREPRSPSHNLLFFRHSRPRWRDGKGSHRADIREDAKIDAGNCRRTRRYSRLRYDCDFSFTFSTTQYYFLAIFLTDINV